MNVSLDVSVPGSPSLIVHFGMRSGGAGRWSIHPCHTSFPLRRVMQEALSTGRVYGFDSVEAEHGDGQAESRDPEALSSAYTSEPFTSLSTSTRGFSPRARHWGAYHYLQQRISFMNARTPKPDVPYQSRRTRKVLRTCIKRRDFHSQLCYTLPVSTPHPHAHPIAHVSDHAFLLRISKDRCSS